MRMIDGDAFAQFIRNTIKRQKYDSLICHNLTVGEILDNVIAELEGTGIDGFKNAPTVEPEPTERTYKRGYADGYHKAEKDYFERTAKDRDDAFKAGIEIEKEAVRKWLLAYHGMSFDLKGRYLPHEVISWLVNDISKKLLDEGGQE